MHILFVCTGNICRSPMAEGIARSRYPELATYAGAGTMPITGSGPTGKAVEAVGEIDVDISGLRGTPLRRSIDPEPDKIYVMTARHVASVQAALPHLTDRVELLDPDGDIPDPYGYDIGFYRTTRDQIAAAIRRRALEWS